MKLKITSFKRNLNGELLEGYRISREDNPSSEYLFTRKRLDGYIKVEDSLNLTQSPSYMGTYSNEEANKKLKEITRRRLEEIAKELKVECPILPF